MGLRMNVWFFHSPHQLVKIFFDKLNGTRFACQKGCFMENQRLCFLK